MKVFVLADNQTSMLTRQVPDGRICSAAMPQKSNVEGAGNNVREPPCTTPLTMAHRTRAEASHAAGVLRVRRSRSAA